MLWVFCAAPFLYHVPQSLCSPKGYLHKAMHVAHFTEGLGLEMRNQAGSYIGRELNTKQGKGRAEVNMMPYTDLNLSWDDRLQDSRGPFWT